MMRRYLYLKAALLAAGIAVWFPLHWWQALLVDAAILLWIGWLQVVVTRRGVQCAASGDLHTFEQLWDLGVVALQTPDGQVFAPRPLPLSWQDIVMRQLGWAELMGSTVASRTEQLDELLSAIGPAKSTPPA
ncbi:hypothetical protein E5CHR_02927 [Variovorax sp. PBL-E5]|nr:hypothetical protein E5CHR_02927 [Variovorax sp. PBL-E5]